MAAKGEKRDPVLHRTPSQKRANNKKLGATASYKRDNAKRKRARRAMEKTGRARKGDGKDVMHKKAISKGGSNAPSNLKVGSRKKNRATTKRKR